MNSEHELANKHLKLMYKYANDQQDLCGGYDNALSNAGLALTMASKTYDPDKGEFSTLFTTCARNLSRQENTFKTRLKRGGDGKGNYDIQTDSMGDSFDVEDYRDTRDITKAENIAGDLLETLPEREANVLRMRFGINGPEMTLEMIGKELGVSRQRVEQIEKRAMNTLKPGLVKSEYFME